LLSEYSKGGGQVKGMISVVQIAKKGQDADDLTILWPDVFSPRYQRKILFTKPIEIRTADLPRWKPKNIIGMRTFEEEEV
jgi:hypothetical protein